MIDVVKYGRLYYGILLYEQLKGLLLSINYARDDVSMRIGVCSYFIITSYTVYVSSICAFVLYWFSSSRFRLLVLEKKLYALEPIMYLQQEHNMSKEKGK